MQSWWPYAGLTLLAFLATLAITPVVRRFALRLGLVDRPDEHRKMHINAIPLGGGIAVLAGALLALVAASFVPDWWEGIIFAGRRNLGALGLAVVVLCLVGVVDDAKGLRARQKLAGQIIAAWLLIQSGLLIEGVQLLGWYIPLGLLAGPLTLFWFLGAINSVNLLDGADGLATTVGIVLTGTIAGMALLNGHALEALIALAMMGSLLGFLVYNRPPATIFLGDAGSMFIGLVAGALAVRSCMKGPATFALAAPVAIWAIPAFDSFMAVLRRKLTGRSLATTDRGHLHHCLQRQGYGSRQLLLWVGVLCLINGAGALLSMYLNDETYAFASVAIVVIVLVATRVFGHAELLLVTAKFRSLGLSLVTPPWRAESPSLGASLQLQGTRDWESVWSYVLEQVVPLELTRVRLNINLPWAQESYHGSWSQDQLRSGAECWHAEIPLGVDGRSVGQIVLSGYGSNQSMGSRLVELGELLAALESQLATLSEVLPSASADAAKVPLPARPDGENQAIGLPSGVSSGGSTASRSDPPTPVHV